MSEENENGAAGPKERAEGESALPGREGVLPAAEAETPHGRARHGSQKEKAQGRKASPATGEGERDLELLLRERDELRDKYLRTLAEAENQRKRAERDKSEYFLFALSDALKEFLGVADSLERALGAESQAEGEGFQEGVRRIHKQLLDVLAKNGVTPIHDAVGGRFDPNIHQALTTEVSETVEEPLVAEELQKGYRIHDRLLRPALVRVVVPKKDAKP